MYGKWCSCTSELLNTLTTPSFLDKFNSTSAKEITTISIRQLWESSKSHQDDKLCFTDIYLSTERDLNWIFEIICYCLTMNYGDNNIVSDVAFLVTKWVESISIKSDNVPQLIAKDILHYFPFLLSMLINFMHNRKDKEGRIYSSHNKHCFLVLSKLSTALGNSTILRRDEWEYVLKFFLQTTEIRMSLEWQQNAGGNKPLLFHLFFIWSLSSINFFPSPRMWRTFAEFCQLWLDRSATVEVWVTIVLESTYEILRRCSMLPDSYNIVVGSPGDDFSSIKRLFYTLPSSLMAKTWFHYLHILDNPIRLASPETLECYIRTLSNYDSTVYLKTAGSITRNFKTAMDGISNVVDMLIDSTAFCRKSNQGVPIFYCDTLLNLFGKWIFYAAVYTTKYNCSCLSPDFIETLGEQSPSLIQDLATPIIKGCSIACGILCRLICSIKPNESVLPIYLIRFYYVLLQIMGDGAERDDLVILYIFSNSANLFLLDLPATNIILHRILISIRDFLGKYDDVYTTNDSESVSALNGSLEILMSVLSIPTYYQEMKLLSLSTTSKKADLNWINVSSVLVDILMNALTMKLESGKLSKILNMIIVTVTELSSSEANYNKHFVVYCKGQVVDRIDFFSHKLTKCITDYWRTLNSRILLGIESLAELGRIHLSHSNERRKTIMWICGYAKLKYTMSSDSGLVELSNILLSTYNCLLAWLTTSFDILADPYCVRLIMETVEYIFSSQSDGRRNFKIQERPTSNYRQTKKEFAAAIDVPKTRLRHIGELIINLIMSHPICNQCPHCMILDEGSALQILNLDDFNQGNIKYFALDNCHILSLFEQTTSTCSRETTLCIAILRTPFARKFFKIEIPSPPLIQIQQTTNDSNPSPFPLLRDYSQPKCFHPTYDENLDCEMSIPTMGDVEMKANCENLTNFVGKQVVKEKNIAVNTNLNVGQKDVECSFTSDSSSSVDDLRNINHLYATRVILSYLGLISLDNIRDKRRSVFWYLDSSGSDFFHQLKMLDLLPTRTHNTAFVCYVGDGQCDPMSIISNYDIPLSDLPLNFINFLMSLGSPVKLADHGDSPGFIGCFHQFWKQKSCSNSDKRLLGDFGGDDKILYWADVLNELAFVIPSSLCMDQQMSSSPLRKPYKSHYMEDDFINYMDNPHNIRKYFADFVAPLTEIPSLIGSVHDPLIIVAWFQNFDDIDKFPLNHLGNQICSAYDSMTKQQREIVGILLVPFKTGLVRVYIRVISKRIVSLETSPLNDGMVINPDTLGSLIRRTVLEIYRSKIRINRDKDRLAHVLRSSYIDKFVKNFRLQMEEATFYTALFQTR